MERPWNDVSQAPEGIAVEVKIDDSYGCRNECVLKRSGGLWFTGDMYVYWTPTHWRHLPRPTTMYTS